MAVKRKFESDSVEASARTAKQLKLVVPFPAFDSDNDVMMSDASSDAELMPTELYHSRLDSSASTVSTSSGNSPVSAYPSFNIYPNPFFRPDGSVDTNSHNFSRYATPPPPKPVGLFEPKQSFHHGSCTQIPKLRIACSAGTNGQRTMWSHCEQCGAIEMVDPDY